MYLCIKEILMTKKRIAHPYNNICLCFPPNLIPILSACAVALSLTSPADIAHAKGHTKHNNSAATATTKKKGASKVTYQRSASEESHSERDRRMYRECKGMHNAGACRGYTR
jgi:hypothetical protein